MLKSIFIETILCCYFIRRQKYCFNEFRADAWFAWWSVADYSNTSCPVAVSCDKSISYLIVYILSQTAKFYSGAASCLDYKLKCMVNVQIWRSVGVGGRLWWNESFNTCPSTSSQSKSFTGSHKTFRWQQQTEQEARRWQLIWKLRCELTTVAWLRYTTGCLQFL